ncbi:helix-turn-helix transcriptional regulator [Mycolicibacterium grossiae]|uniref:helix-turn-helix transcriptional regulator n=3 Tax=Mycolicibacterium grossiae TaxID=1552759 RepID=UPI0011F12D7A|nr:AAA family ATPase [Mycolicibacterium grossiae]QEM44787.1 AAA family ATPase [Mycolicibacterium grossiae]
MARVILRGRSEAMSRALGVLDRAARTGQGALLVIGGEPGIGKSAVLRAISEQAGRAGFLVGAGKAEQGDQIAPGAPLLVALRSGTRPLLPAEAFAGLAPLYETPLWLVDRISGLLEELAVHHPVLLVLDDLQWADHLTRFALRVLPARLAGSPVVWAVASRWAPRDVVDELLTATDDVPAVTRIDLGPLGAGDIEGIASDRLGARPDEQVRGLLAGVGGNPFWAVQVIDGLTRRHGAGAGDPIAGLAAGVRTRLQRLSGTATALVRLAAVWGRPLALHDATALLPDIADGHVAAAAREAVDGGLLATTAGGPFFPHDLVREAVYADIAPAERRRLHRSCARYVRDGGGSALAAAGHFHASAQRDDDEAVVALQAAARECTASMPDQAADFARRAFELITAGRPSWWAAGECAVETLVNVQRDAEALAVADRLLGRSDTGDLGAGDEILARLELQACRALWCLGDCEQMERRATAAARADVSDALRARLASARALAATRTRAAADAERLASAARDEGRRLGDGYAQRLAVVALIEAARNQGRHRRALDLFTDLRRFSDTAYEAEEIRTLQHLDRYDDAEALLAKGREASAGADALLPSMLYAQMWQDFDLARFDAAEAGAGTLLRLADEAGNDGYRLNARVVLAAIAAHRDENVAAVAALRLTATDAGAPDVDGAPRRRLVHGWATAAAGDPVGAVEILAPLLAADAVFGDPWPWTPPWPRLLTRIGLDAGDRAFAGRAAALADVAAQRNPGVATLAGSARHAHGLRSGDPEVLADAVAVLRGAPRPLLLAAALHDLGAALLTGGRTADGTASLVEAAEIFRRAGAARSSRAVDAVLAAHGIRGVRIRHPEPRPQSGWGALTPTELRVVELIGSGHTNRSAAEELGVSPNTVNTHVRSVFRKLDVRSRVQLTIAYRERRS